jgi:redox-sensitive bicupin YhaK (pirin superfamily)
MMNNHHSVKRISKVVQLPEQHQGFRNVSLTSELGSIDPFIVLTEFWMPKAFFPPHPHAGFSVMTYMFPDSEGAFINRDSLGDHSRIEAGAVHLTQAGKGMLHEEIPEIEGQICHGLQMWLNHSSQDRFVEPKAMHVDARTVPEVQPNEQVLVRVLLGEFQGVRAAITPLPQVDLLDVHLKPHAVFTHRVPTGNISFVMMIKGLASSDGTTLEPATCLKFSDEGDDIEISTAAEAASLLVATGKPLNEPILFGGPFVMSNNEQLRQTKLRYNAGEMGHLEPSPIFHHSH